jgi:protein-S-isoprenylcysteine O-methyltransferase Ste14
MDQHQGGQDPSAPAVAGVIVRPPLLFLGAVLLAVVLDWLWPLPLALPGGALRWLLAAGLAGAGVAIMAAAIRGFSRAGTPVPTVEPTRALVTTGVHGSSRNPIYVGMFLIYFGLAAAAASAWAIGLAIPVALTMRYGVVAREEAYLERRFPDAYRDYKARVRRWL